MHATVVNRMVVDHRVVDHERIVGIEATEVPAAVVDEVVGNKIKTVWFL